MKKSGRKRIILFGLICIIAIVCGIIIQSREASYRSFFVENNALGSLDETSEPKESNKEPEAVLVNINTDNPLELQTLNGIGEKLALRIIEYRKEHGDFEVIEDIMRVNGIAEKKFEAIKDYIYVSE